MAKKLRIIPLGGLGEVGKNMMVMEYDDRYIIIDAGIMFPENDMLGIDYIIPDFRWLLDKAHKVEGIIVTHGHEDHTGAITHVLEAIRAPVYATPLTRGLLEAKLKAGKMLDSAELHTFNAGDSFRLGPFRVETFHVCHSIPDGVGLGITTPVGLVVHSGDFKFDHTPVDGRPPDFAKLAEFAGRGVLVLLSDSTNADRPGWTPSETVVEDALDKVFRRAKGRLIVATFASLISRIQQVVHIARRHGRKLAVAGFTMNENVRIAQKMGYLDIPPDMLISLEEADKLPPEKVVIVATGTQGEPTAVLGRLAHGRHRLLDVKPGDTVVMSAHSIPGNEEMVHRIINRLFQRGAHVIYDPIAPVHVSGHASQEEMKLLLNLVRPKFFVPIHGELRHLKQHGFLAQEVGIPPENIAVVENGTVLEFTRDSMTIGERVPGGYVFVDGRGVGDIGPLVMRDRERLGRDGVVIVSVMIGPDGRSLVDLDMDSKGFVLMEDADELFDRAGTLVRQLTRSNNGKRLQTQIRDTLSRFFYNETKRRPMVFVFVHRQTV